MVMNNYEKMSLTAIFLGLFCLFVLDFLTVDSRLIIIIIFFSLSVVIAMLNNLKKDIVREIKDNDNKE